MENAILGIEPFKQISLSDPFFDSLNIMLKFEFKSNESKFKIDHKSILKITTKTKKFNEIISHFKIKKLLPISIYTLTILIAGCGGGSGGSDDLSCSDFAYQEDAQQAFRAGASQLDGDKDGIACEALSPRPNNTPTQPINNFQSINFLTSSGYLIQVSSSGNSYSAIFNKIGYSSTSNASVYTDNSGVIQVSTGYNTLKYFRANNLHHIGWMPVESETIGATAFGVDNTDLAHESSLIGLYKLLGQKCVPNTLNCEPVTATASISSIGNVEICFETEFTNSCTSKASGVLFSVPPSNPVTSWSGGRLIGSISNHSIGITYNNTQANPTDLKTAYAFFGFKESVVQMVPSNFSTMKTFAQSGLFSVQIPNVSRWQVSANSPLTGFFKDLSGNIYLRSNRGPLIAWSIESGLQNFSNSQ